MISESSKYETLNCLGLILPLHELPSNISIESVLAKSHVDMLVQLAGCSGVQTRDPCDEQCFHSRYRSQLIH